MRPVVGQYYCIRKAALSLEALRTELTLLLLMASGWKCASLHKTTVIGAHKTIVNDAHKVIVIDAHKTCPWRWL